MVLVIVKLLHQWQPTWFERTYLKRVCRNGGRSGARCLNKKMHKLTTQQSFLRQWCIGQSGYSWGRRAWLSPVVQPVTTRGSQRNSTNLIEIPPKPMVANLQWFRIWYLVVQAVIMYPRWSRRRHQRVIHAGPEMRWITDNLSIILRQQWPRSITSQARISMFPSIKVVKWPRTWGFPRAKWA